MFVVEPYFRIFYVTYRVPIRVDVTDWSGQTGVVRYRYTGPVWPETGPNRLNSNLNSKAAVQPVRNGLPVGLTGRFDW